MNSKQQQVPMDEGQLEQMQKKQEQMAQMEEMKNSILTQILTPEARVRLGNIKLVRPEKVAQVEVQLIQAAQSGRIPDRITEQQLIQMLEKAEGPKKTESKVTFQRRKLSSDEEDI